MLNQYIRNTPYTLNLQAEPLSQGIVSLKEEGKNCSGDEVVTGPHSQSRVELF